MKIIQESIFANSVRSFFVALFAMIGIFVGLILFFIAIAAIYSVEEDDGFSSDIKIVSDADGKRKYLGSDAPVILQISIHHTIGSEDLTAEKIHTMLLDSRESDLKNDRVKAVLLVIDSPGGGVNDSDSIYRLLKDYKDKYSLPIFAYVDGMCASGGYYIACAADKIYASDVSLVGSIGVLSWPPFFNVTDAIKKIGVESLTLSAGKDKDLMNPLRPWKEGEQEIYQKLLNFYYDKFVSIVIDNRPQINKQLLVKDYGARVFPAPEAKEYGYIDGSNFSRESVLKELAIAAKIEDKYQVVTYQKGHWWKKLFEQNTSVFSGKIIHEHRFQSAELSQNPFAYIYK